MKKQILEICKQHDVKTKRVNLEGEISEILSRIQHMIISREIIPDNPRTFMADLWKLESNLNIQKLDEDSEFQNFIADLMNDKKYCIEGNFIVCNKFIRCTMIQSSFKISVLTTEKIQKVKDLDFGITQYRILKNKTIREVYCKGKHPNLNLISGQFCLDSKFLNLPLNYQNLLLLEELLSQFNISDCYLDKNDFKLLQEILNEK